MKALCWHGKSDMRYETVPDPKILDPRDAIIKVTACAICGSDLHIFNGVIPEMEKGDVIGHETMGEVVEVGRDNTKLKVGDRVVVPVHDLLRRVLLLQAWLLLGMRTIQSRCGKSREAVGSLTGGPVWLLTSAGRIPRRPG